MVPSFARRFPAVASAQHLGDGARPFAVFRLKRQTPGPRGDPGVLRDDCSSAPLEPCRASLYASRGKVFDIGPKGQPAEEI